MSVLQLRIEVTESPGQEHMTYLDFDFVRSNSSLLQNVQQLAWDLLPGATEIKATYFDDEGDVCTLTERTANDALSFASPEDTDGNRILNIFVSGVFPENNQDDLTAHEQGDPASAACEYEVVQDYTCDGCERALIAGQRFHSEEWENFDLCADCHNLAPEDRLNAFGVFPDHKFKVIESVQAAPDVTSDASILPATAEADVAESAKVARAEEERLVQEAAAAKVAEEAAVVEQAAVVAEVELLCTELATGAEHAAKEGLARKKAAVEAEHTAETELARAEKELAAAVEPSHADEERPARDHKNVSVSAMSKVCSGVQVNLPPSTTRFVSKHLSYAAAAATEAGHAKEGVLGQEAATAAQAAGVASAAVESAAQQRIVESQEEAARYQKEAKGAKQQAEEATQRIVESQEEIARYQKEATEATKRVEEVEAECCRYKKEAEEAIAKCQQQAALVKEMIELSRLEMEGMYKKAAQEAMNHAVEEASQENARCQHEMEEAIKRILKSEAEVARYQKEANEATQRVEEVEAELGRYKKEAEEAVQHAQDVEAERAKCKQEAAEATREMMRNRLEMEEECGRHKKEVQVAMYRAVEEVSRENARCKHETEEATQRLVKSEEEVARYQKEAKEATQRVEDVEAELGRYKKEAEEAVQHAQNVEERNMLEMEEECGRHKKEVQEAVQRVVDIEAERARFKEEGKELKALIKVMEKSQKRFKKQLDESEVAKEKAEVLAETVEGKCLELEQVVESLRAELASAEDRAVEAEKGYVVVP